MPIQPSRRQCRRYPSRRPARLKPQGCKDWISLSMIDWSAAGAALSGVTDKVEIGPALLEVPSRYSAEQILLPCDVVWRTEQKVGLRLSRLVSR